MADGLYTVDGDCTSREVPVLESIAFQPRIGHGTITLFAGSQSMIVSNSDDGALNSSLAFSQPLPELHDRARVVEQSVSPVCPTFKERTP